METQNDRYVRVSIRSIFHAVFVVVILLALFYIKDLVFVFLTSIVIASFVESAVRRLRKRGLGRTIAVVLIYFLVLTLAGLFMYLFIPVFFQQMSELSGLVAQYLPSTGSLSANESQITTIVSSFQAITTNATSGTLQVAIALFGGVYNFILLVILSFYLSVNNKAIENFLRIVIPQSEVEQAVSLWRRTEHKIGLWFQGQMLMATLVGVIIYLLLFILNIQYSLILAVTAAILELIPFGIILAAVPAIASGFISKGSTGALEVGLVYLIVHEFEVNLIAPLIVQKVVGISSLVVILAILVGLKLAGFWGVMLAIPTAVLLMEFVEDVKKKKGISN